LLDALMIVDIHATAHVAPSLSPVDLYLSPQARR
jgi:hypothetical protein